MNHTKTIIVSPSGKFYGSEQVLFDFLTETRNTYTVYLPLSDKLHKKLVLQNKHRVRVFVSLKKFYLKIFLQLLLGKINAVYSNEGGHIRYLKVLARVFPRAKFIIHIRIIEDTDSRRIGILPNNMVLLSISDYITGLITHNEKSIKTIYDPYILRCNQQMVMDTGGKKIRAGIIGRVTETKGVNAIQSFCDFLENNYVTDIEMHFFGDVEQKIPSVSTFVEKSRKYRHVVVQFHGFKDNKKDLYDSIHIVLHFNKVEPLGRIFFESLDYGLPFIGFNEGGIGEIAKVLHLEDCMINDSINWERELYRKILNLKEALQKYSESKEICNHTFSANKYCKTIEEIILV